MPRASHPRVRNKCSISVPSAAADVEHAAAWFDEAGDEFEVYAHSKNGALPQTPSCEARFGVTGFWAEPHSCLRNPGMLRTPRQKPRNRAMKSGSSSKNASCPRSVPISTKLTFAAALFNARATARDCAVGNSQSDENETRQNRVRVPGKRRGQIPIMLGGKIEPVHRRVTVRYEFASNRRTKLLPWWRR